MDNLDKAYKEFAEKGTEGITIFNRKNDSTENLIHKLLSLHIDKINFITSLIKKQNSTYNNLFDLISAYPDQIKFNKQLFTHRENPAMNLTFIYGINALKPITIPLQSHYLKIILNFLRI